MGLLLRLVLLLQLLFHRLGQLLASSVMRWDTLHMQRKTIGVIYCLAADWRRFTCIRSPG